MKIKEVCTDWELHRALVTDNYDGAIREYALPKAGVTETIGNMTIVKVAENEYEYLCHVIICHGHPFSSKVLQQFLAVGWELASPMDGYFVFDARGRVQDAVQVLSNVLGNIEFISRT